VTDTLKERAMSKDIDTSDVSSLGQEDLQYLADRALLTPEQEAEFLGDGNDAEFYEDMTVKALTAEIDSRNASRSEDDQIVPEGKAKADLVAALTADDED
jgi:hypothetical protein